MAKAQSDSREDMRKKKRNESEKKGGWGLPILAWLLLSVSVSCHRHMFVKIVIVVLDYSVGQYITVFL